MDGNLAVAEIKASLPTADAILNDLRKLCQFRRLAGYDAAFYLVYGLSRGHTDLFFERCRDASCESDDVRLDDVDLLIHDAPRRTATPTPWPV
jgi:hypothetical protein